MWIEFKNESDELIARIYNDYILKNYVNDLICAKVRKAEIKLFLMIYKKEQI
jgi:hypothetical protein